MSYIVEQNNIDGYLKIKSDNTLSGNIYKTFSTVGEELVINITSLYNVEKIKSLILDIDGVIPNHKYLEIEYRTSRDNTNFTDWLDLNNVTYNHPIINSYDLLYIDIRFTRKGDVSFGYIDLKKWEIDCVLDRNLQDGESIINIVENGQNVVIRPPYIYKVFNLTDIEVISSPSLDGLSLYWRYSQDYGRTVSKWEIFNKENVSSAKISPIRFFQVEYLIKSENISSNIKIYDINLIGDFQNVTLDSQKTNLIGIRENCSCILLGIENGQFVGQENVTGDNSGIISQTTSGISSGSDCGVGYLNSLSDEQKQALFQPYSIPNEMNFLNQVSNDVTTIFGHEVSYFLTDPNSNGIDYTFHEYQLYNYVCEKTIKVSVDQNNFPDNQITINQFDLSLFDTFEIHITKDEFKKAFGVDKRPSKQDFLWFCNLNRMFQVEHAQQFRNFNNSAIYYKVMLKKYSQKANVIGVNDSISDKVRELTRNSTIDELFGVYNEEDKSSVANKEQTRVLTKDTLRVDVNCIIEEDNVMNGSGMIIKNVYNLSTVGFGEQAVVYRNMKNIYEKSDNLSFFCWFKIENYIDSENYNLFTYYDDQNNNGIKIDIINDSFNVLVNNTTYSMDVSNILDFIDTIDLFENRWLCYLVNIEQRNEKIYQYLYQREDESYSNKISLIIKNELPFNSDVIVIDNSVKSSILGSDMYISNLRLFNDIIDEKVHSKTLVTYLVRDDAKYLIFADNCNKKIILPSLPLSNGMDSQT